MQTTSFSELNLATLNPGKRHPLAADATSIEVLEAANLEKIRLRILFQRVQPAERRVDLLVFKLGEPVLRRRVILHGEQSGKIYVHADSSVALDRLSAPVRRALLASEIPLETLWMHHGIEGFNEVLHSGTERAGDLAFYFGLEIDEHLLVRTCRLSSDGRPVMLTTEHLEVSK